MSKEAVLAIRAYIHKYLFAPRFDWPANEFRRRSYSRWAATEIIAMIENDPINRDPISNIKKFMDDMDHYLNMSENRETYFIFMIAKETAEDIICLLLEGVKK